MAGFKEAHTGVVDLDGDDPIPVEIMLKYFYTGKYENRSTRAKNCVYSCKLRF